MTCKRYAVLPLQPLVDLLRYIDRKVSSCLCWNWQRTVNGRNYWTFEYDLEAPGYGVSAFATVAIGNGSARF